jgi:hypothetical protein
MLLADGDWGDSSSLAARVRRELADSLARYGRVARIDALSGAALRGP